MVYHSVSVINMLTGSALPHPHVNRYRAHVSSLNPPVSTSSASAYRVLMRIGLAMGSPGCCSCFPRPMIWLPVIWLLHLWGSRLIVCFSYYQMGSADVKLYSHIVNKIERIYVLYSKSIRQRFILAAIH